MNKEIKASFYYIVVIIGVTLLALVTNTKHQRLFYIRCVDAKGNMTYEARSTEYPVSNSLKGLGTCSYVYR